MNLNFEYKNKYIDLLCNQHKVISNIPNLFVNTSTDDFFIY